MNFSWNDDGGIATSPNASSSSSSSVPQTKSGVNSGLEADLRLQVTSVESYNGTLIWKIPEITRHAQDAIKKRLISFFSPPFYTGRLVQCARKVEYVILYDIFFLLNNDLLI